MKATLVLIIILVSFLVTARIDPIKSYSLKEAIINVPQDYPTIQNAVNAANPGDTIRVSSGTYVLTNRVIINKSLTLLGENATNTIIDGTKGLTALQVTADNVTIKGLTVKCSGLGQYSEGFWLSYIGAVIKIYANYTTIDSNIISGGTFGIYVGNHSNLYSVDDVYLGNHSYNHLSNNTITQCDVGIELEGDTNANIIDNNNISSCPQFGIRKDANSENTIADNLISRSGNAIFLNFCNNDEVLNNTVTRNHIGVEFGSTSGIKLIANVIADNDIGIWMSNSDNNTIYHNDVVLNKEQVAISSPCINEWDNGAEGNYWSNYTGPDSDGDGIGDNPFYIGGLPVTVDNINIDRYPLIYPYVLLFDQAEQIAIDRSVELTSSLNDLQTSLDELNASEKNLPQLISDITTSLNESTALYQILNETYLQCLSDFERQYGYFNYSTSSVEDFLKSGNSRFSSLSTEVYDFPFVLLIIDLIVGAVVVGLLSARTRNLKKAFVLGAFITLLILTQLTQTTFLVKAQTAQVNLLQSVANDDLQLLSGKIENLTVEIQVLQAKTADLNVTYNGLQQTVNYLANGTGFLDTNYNNLLYQYEDIPYQYNFLRDDYQYLSEEIANFKANFDIERPHLILAEGVIILEAILFPLFLALLIPRKRTSRKTNLEKIIASTLTVALLLATMSTCVAGTGTMAAKTITYSEGPTTHSIALVNTPSNITMAMQLNYLINELGQLTSETDELQIGVNVVNTTYNNVRSSIDNLNGILTWHINMSLLENDYSSVQNDQNLTSADFMTTFTYFSSVKQDFESQMNSLQISATILVISTIIVPAILMLLVTRIWLRKIELAKKGSPRKNSSHPSDWANSDLKSNR